MDTVSLAGVSSVAQHGVRRLLLVAERPRVVLPGLLLWYTLLPSGSEQPLVQTVRSVSHGGFWENFPLLRAFVALFAPGNLDSSTFALVSFSSLVFGCCLWSTSYWIFREI